MFNLPQLSVCELTREGLNSKKEKLIYIKKKKIKLYEVV